MKINLYGYGFVGKVHYEILKDHHEINIIDPKYTELEQSNFVPDCCIVCVSTLEADDGACDMSNVINVVATISSTIPILIKSTISLEGWRDLKTKFPSHIINFSPEFLRASSALDDFKNMTVMYLSEERAQWWAKIFNPHWKDLQFIVAPPEELILMKYFRNSFLAIKVSFFNQVYDLCKATGVDYNEVAAGIAQDTRIGSSHTAVTDERGWGGMCFPKDTAAIINTANQFNVQLSLINEARKYNLEIRNEDITNRT